jgi:hypothetical protein
MGSPSSPAYATLEYGEWAIYQGERMSYQVTITTQDGQETEIVTKADYVFVEDKDGMLHATIKWCRVDLFEEDGATDLLKGLWPGQDRLTLSSDGASVFTGAVSGVGYCKEYVKVEAHGDGSPDPDALSVRVEEDDTDPMSARIVIDNKGHGPVTVHFGDGTPAVDDDGDGQGFLSHTYATEGQWTLTVTDKNEPSRNRSVFVTVPFSSGS